MPKRTAWALAATILSVSIVSGAEAPPAVKKAFMDLKTTYVSLEITQVGSKDFSAPKDALNDGAYRLNRSLKFEMPLGMVLPDSCPSGTPAEQAMEQGRCMGWSFNIEDSADAMEQVTSGKVDLSKNPMFTAGRYSIEDIAHSRYRDEIDHGFATSTTTYKGSGVAYIAKGGMLLCDFKSMVCDLSSLSMQSSMGDEVTITTTSDVPGSETQTRKQDPQLLLPQVPQEITAKMVGFPLTLPGPSTLTFTGPGTFQGNAKGPDVVVKMTVSSKPAPTASAPAK